MGFEGVPAAAPTSTGLAALPAADQGPLTEAQFRQAVDGVAAGSAPPALLFELLDERHACFQGKGAAAVTRMRSWALLALRRGPSPWAEARDRVVEELQTSLSPYAVAAAARVLPHVCSEADGRLGSALRTAAETVARSDDLVDLSRWGGVPAAQASTSLSEAATAGSRQDAAETTTASAEVARAQAWFDSARLVRARSHEPDAVVWGRAAVPRPTALALENVVFEDQAGRRLEAAEFFFGQPTFVVFFYTRCDNPRKCSLTIGRLAQLQALLGDADLLGTIRTAAITYDPQFNHPQRLRGYAESRSVRLDDNHRVLRVVEGAADLQKAFDVGAGFVSTLVNRHRIEAHLLDASGRRCISYTRLMWSEQVVLEDVRARLATDHGQTSAAGCAVVAEPASKNSPPVAASSAVPAVAAVGPRRLHRAGVGMAPVWALLLALFPKCPLCGAGYLSLTGLAALPQLPGWYWTWPLFVLALLVNLAALVYLARRRRRWGAVLLGAAGLVVLLGPGVAGGSDLALVAGVLLCGVASLLSVSAAAQPVRAAS